MGATLTTASNILKEIYEPRIRDQLQNHLKTSKRLEQTSEGVTSDVGGKYVVFPIHVRRNTGIGARLENEQLPTAGNQGYARAQVGLAYLYGAIRLTGQAMQLAKTNSQSFAAVLDQEVNGIQTDLAKDYNRQVYGTSVGVLATVSGANTGTTIPTTNTQYLQIGMLVDIYNSAGSTLKTQAGGVTITAIVKDTSFTVSVAPGTATAANDVVVRQGNLNRETIGLSQIVDNTGTLYNIDPTVEPEWKSVVSGNSGVSRALSESLMIKMVDDIYTNGGNTTAIFTTLGVRRSYFNLLQQQRQYVNTETFDGGFKGLGFTTDNGDIPVVSDVDCQPKSMYFINEKELKIYRESDWSFMDEDGSKWQRVIGYDAYEATLYKYCQLGTHRRNSHGLIEDITES
ncbi:phage major capsid protein [Streptomyces sp. NPDC012769]|uniref:phage major capsid protein n=1 Tax=Streptomyces sp. NPDC012769 TaxID=3364848 RepID=UPI00369AEAB9